MKTLEKTIQVYIAKNGKEFLSSEECESYENNVLSRFEKIKYFIIYHGADFTEGRGFQSHSYVAVESDWNHSELLEMYCQIKFGPRIDWMYHSPAQVWAYSSIDEKKYHSGIPKYGKKIFLSHSDIDGLPKATLIDNKTKKEQL